MKVLNKKAAAKKSNELQKTGSLENAANVSIMTRCRSYQILISVFFPTFAIMLGHFKVQPIFSYATNTQA